MSTNVKKMVAEGTNETSEVEESASSPQAAPATTGNVPSVTAAAVSAFLDAVDAFALALGDGVVLPQPDQVKRLPKPRKGATTIVSTVADLSSRYRVTSQSFPVDAMLARQQLAATLVPVAERIAAAQKLVGDVSIVAASGAWEGAMVNYGLLKSEARGNAVLRKALVPVREQLRVKYVTAEGTKTVKKSRSAKKAAAASSDASAEAATAATVAASQAAAPAITAPAKP